MKNMDETLIVLTTAPAGLGHIRVMAALREGLPDEARVAVLGIKDTKMQALHRITSINPALREVMEFVQNNPVAEGGFTRWYRKVLRHNPQEMAEQLMEVIERQDKRPKRVMVVCTHFGIAHQLGAVKAQLSRQLGIPIELAVVVTDDSPQQLWAVPTADAIFVPSESTRASLETTLSGMKGQMPKMVVVPYPVSLKLGDRLAEKRFEERMSQLDPSKKVKLEMIVPVSGAAVQLSYFTQLIETIHQLHAIEVVVVARESKSTSQFLGWCRERDYIRVMAAVEDAQVVQLYEQAYAEGMIGVEVTKPSEQTFKALLTPKQVGGSILLFSEPVGRQEEDNLLFMNRHHLLPDLEEMRKLKQLTGDAIKTDKDLLAAAKEWRGVVLPKDGAEAAVLIEALWKAGILRVMGKFGGFMPGHKELSSDGVKRIWNLLI